MNEVRISNVFFYRSNTGHFHAVGAVFGHPKHEEGAQVYTSRICKLCIIDNHLHFDTRNSSYVVKEDMDSFGLGDKLLVYTMMEEVREEFGDEDLVD